MTGSFSAEGGCACAKVRYRLTAPPLFVHCCHCRWCQRETGAAFALNAMIERECVELLGDEPACIDTPSESGRGQKIHRCPGCHVALWSHYGGAGPAIAFIRVGTLDEPDRFPPDIQIYTASKQPWVELSHAMPAVKGYYKMSEYWPEESIARLKTAKEAHAARRG
ncbi:MAG: aldehyde-activating protein [Parvularcula sp.]|nr:aldehyde-activating protein [Parvularcula sp.]